MLAGTDNDYSVTQNAGRHDGGAVRSLLPSDETADRVERIQCDIGTFKNCFAVNATGTLGAALPAGFEAKGYQLMPGVLHAYKASPQDLGGLTRVQSPLVVAAAPTPLQARKPADLLVESPRADRRMT